MATTRAFTLDTPELRASELGASELRASERHAPEEDAPAIAERRSRPRRAAALTVLTLLAICLGIVPSLSPLEASDFRLSTARTTIEYSALLGDGTGDVTIQLRQEHPTGAPLAFISGISFSLSNDPSILKPITLEPSGILLLLNGGVGPDVVHTQLAADGVTADWTFSLSGGMDILFPADLEIGTLTISTIESTWAGNDNGDTVLLSSENPPSIVSEVQDLVSTNGTTIGAIWEFGELEFEPGPRGFLRGDANQDGVVEGIPDAIKLLAGLFNPAIDLECLGASDINADGWVDLGDAIYLLNWKFGPDGPPPPPPFPDCGTDPSGNGLDCAEPSC